MFFCRNWEVVGFEVDSSTGEEERDVNFSFANVPWSCIFRVKGPDGRAIGFGEFLDRVEEDLIPNFSWDGAIVERRVLLGIDVKLAIMNWEVLLWWF